MGRGEHTPSDRAGRHSPKSKINNADVPGMRASLRNSPPGACGGASGAVVAMAL